MVKLGDYHEAVQALSAENRDRLPVIEWLLSGGAWTRRTGRSSVMAICFMRLAMYGERLRIFDHAHISAEEDKRRMVSTIDELFPHGGYNFTSNGTLSVDNSPVNGKHSMEPSTIGWDENELIEDFKLLTRILVRSNISLDDLHKIVDSEVVGSVMST